MQKTLPEGFEDLTPFLDWAEPTEVGRNKRRWAASLAESQQFYDTMIVRAPAALDYLDQFPLDALTPEQQTLLNLCLALVECSVTIEMYGDPSPKYVFPIDRFVPLHDAWPIAAGSVKA